MIFFAPVGMDLGVKLLMKKDFVLMCFVFFPLDIFSFLMRR